MADKVMISFGKKYEEEYEYLMNKPKRSNYIAELIRKDRLGLEMKQDEYELIQLDRIKEAVRSVMNEYDFSNSKPISNQNEEAEEMDYSDLADDLFNI